MVWLQPIYVAVVLVLLSFVRAAPADSQSVIAKLDQQIEQHIHTGLAAVKAAKEEAVVLRTEKADGRDSGDMDSYYKAEEVFYAQEKQTAANDLDAAKAEQRTAKDLKATVGEVPQGQAQATHHRNIRVSHTAHDQAFSMNWAVIGLIIGGLAAALLGWRKIIKSSCDASGLPPLEERLLGPRLKEYSNDGILIHVQDTDYCSGGSDADRASEHDKLCWVPKVPSLVNIPSLTQSQSVQSLKMSHSASVQSLPPSEFRIHDDDSPRMYDNKKYDGCDWFHLDNPSSALREELTKETTEILWTHEANLSFTRLVFIAWRNYTTSQVELRAGKQQHEEALYFLQMHHKAFVDRLQAAHADQIREAQSTTASAVSLHTESMASLHRDTMSSTRSLHDGVLHGVRLSARSVPGGTDLDDEPPRMSSGRFKQIKQQFESMEGPHLPPKPAWFFQFND